MKLLLHLLTMSVVACIASTHRNLSGHSRMLLLNQKVPPSRVNPASTNRNSKRWLLHRTMVATATSNKRASIVSILSRSENRKLDMGQYKRRVYLRALEERNETRDLRSCWVDNSGLCCSKSNIGCRYYRRQRKTNVRTNIFFFGMMPFHPGNFWYNGCNVQCVCESYHASCTPGQVPALSTTTTTTTPSNTATASTSTTTETTITTTTTTTTTSATTTTTTPTTTTTTSSTVSDTTATTQLTTTSLPLVFRSRYCPDGVSTLSSFVRILNGNPLTGCTRYPGIVTVVTANFAIPMTLCTGVVTSSTTITIPNNCAQLFDEPIEIIDPYDGRVLHTPPLLSDVDIEQLPFGGPYELQLPEKEPVMGTGCPGVACVYHTRMEDVVQQDQCVVVAGGYTSQAASDQATLSFMKVKRILPVGECNFTNNPQELLFDSALQYKCLISGASSTCVGDVGGAVVCPLVTGEVVVMGQVENIPCDSKEDTLIFFYPVDDFTVNRAKTRQILSRNPRKKRLGKSKRRNILLGNRRVWKNTSARTRRMDLLLGNSRRRQLLLRNTMTRPVRLG